MDIKEKIREVQAAGYYGVDSPIALAYLERLEAHIRYVREAGKLIGVWDKLLEVHDESKFSREEFAGYAMHFHGGGDPDGFAHAWLHHLHNNAHHWNYWVHPGDDFTVKGSCMEANVLPMPGLYALEMISDWMGAGMAYSGSWDMRDWLTKNLPRIKVHSQTREFLTGELVRLGYEEVVRFCWP